MFSVLSESHDVYPLEITGTIRIKSLEPSLCKAVIVKRCPADIVDVGEKLHAVEYSEGSTGCSQCVNETGELNFS